MIEKDFVTEGLKRTKIDEFLEKELERAGYGGMEVQVTPLGTMVVVYAERPGMVIGRGGKTVRAITQTLKTDFDLDNPQVEVKEVDVPELNPKIMASKIANMLQRGMHFRRVAYSTIRRIMGAGAQGVEITISGKIRGSRSAVAKFVAHPDAARSACRHRLPRHYPAPTASEYRWHGLRCCAAYRLSLPHEYRRNARCHPAPACAGR